MRRRDWHRSAIAFLLVSLFVPATLLAPPFEVPHEPPHFEHETPTDLPGKTEEHPTDDPAVTEAAHLRGDGAPRPSGLLGAYAVNETATDLYSFDRPASIGAVVAAAPVFLAIIPDSDDAFHNVFGQDLSTSKAEEMKQARDTFRSLGTEPTGNDFDRASVLALIHKHPPGSPLVLVGHSEGSGPEQVLKLPSGEAMTFKEIHSEAAKTDVSCFLLTCNSPDFNTRRITFDDAAEICRRMDAASASGEDLTDPEAVWRIAMDTRFDRRAKELWITGPRREGGKVIIATSMLSFELPGAASGLTALLGIFAVLAPLSIGKGRLTTFWRARSLPSSYFAGAWVTRLKFFSWLSCFALLLLPTALFSCVVWGGGFYMFLNGLAGEWSILDCGYVLGATALWVGCSWLLHVVHARILRMENSQEIKVELPKIMERALVVTLALTVLIAIIAIMADTVPWVAMFLFVPTLFIMFLVIDRPEESLSRAVVWGNQIVASRRQRLNRQA